MKKSNEINASIPIPMLKSISGADAVLFIHCSPPPPPPSPPPKARTAKAAQVDVEDDCQVSDKADIETGVLPQSCVGNAHASVACLTAVLKCSEQSAEDKRCAAFFTIWPET